MEIEAQIFSEPSGNVRGVVAAFAPMRGKQVRVAHATLLTDGAPDIGTYVPKRLSLEEIDVVVRTLSAFTEKVRSLAAQ